MSSYSALRPTATILYFRDEFDNEPTKRDFSRVKDDGFWAFLRGYHPLDNLRKRRLEQIIDLIQTFGEMRPRVIGKSISMRVLNDRYRDNFRVDLLNGMLTAIFGTQVGKTTNLIFHFFRKLCGAVFRAEQRIDDFIISYVLEDYPGDTKDIFISSRPIINAEITRNIKLADKVFEIVPEQRRIGLQELMTKLVKTKEYKDIKEKNADAPHIEPIKFIGFLQLYWGDVFKIQPNYETQEVCIKRQVLHHQKPSQERKYMTEIMEMRPSYPLPFNLLTSSHLVEFFNAHTPSDGFFLRLLEHQAQLDYVESELRKFAEFPREERERYRLHKNYIFEGTCCLALFEEHNLFSTDQTGEQKLKERTNHLAVCNRWVRRCQIVGQSNGLAMVQCVDYPYIGLLDLKNIYQVPPSLLGIYQTGVYAVLRGCQMASKIECEHWKGATEALYSEDFRLVAKFVNKAARIDYSGRKKFGIFAASIAVNKFGDVNSPNSTHELILCLGLGTSNNRLIIQLT
uniref:Uncharacterized protein n=1 Tax=Globodera rostochiensis TaxID=31243 RepID=A0A914GWX9_GLORO